MITRAKLDEIWMDATNAVCQSMQERKMCNCPDGNCLAAKIMPEEKDYKRECND